MSPDVKHLLFQDATVALRILLVQDLTTDFKSLITVLLSLFSASRRASCKEIKKECYSRKSLPGVTALAWLPYLKIIHVFLNLQTGSISLNFNKNAKEVSYR